MSKKYPNWYYKTSSTLGYPGIHKNIRKLIHLLRNNGWNTTSSSGCDYEGVVIIDCYSEQSGGMLDNGGVAFYLRSFLQANGYEHFEITHKIFQWHGQIVVNEIWLKMLSPEYNARWK